MTHPLSLQSSSSNADFEARKTNQRLQPAQTKLTDLPIALVKHAMSFLPFKSVALCKRVSKTGLNLDYLHWMRISGCVEGRQLARCFEAQGAPSLVQSTLDWIKTRRQELVRLDLVKNITGVEEDEWGKEVNEFFKKLGPQSDEPYFPRLKELRLSDDRSVDADKFFEVGEEIIAKIAFHAPSLTHLVVTPENGSICSAHFGNLESLTLVAPDEREDLSMLAKSCPKLKELNCSIVTGRELEMIAQVPQLARLQVNHIFSEEDLEPLYNHKNLRRLELVDCDRLRNGGIKSLATIPLLEELHIVRGFYGFTDLSCLAAAGSLKKLTLGFWKYEPAMKSFASLQGVKQLEELDVVCCVLSEEVCISLGKCANLRRLSIAFEGTRGTITDGALAHLAGCQELRDLTIKVNEDGSVEEDPLLITFTTSGVIDLLKKLPHLRRFELDLRELAESPVEFPGDLEEIEGALKQTHPNLMILKP